MNDRELLELAARVAGVEYNFICPTGANVGDFTTLSDRFWNPLTDDGDALRLAVKLGIDIAKAQVDYWDKDSTDPYAATRRAIARAAAEIGENP